MEVIEVKFVGWGEEGAEDFVVEQDEVEVGIWAGMASVGVEIYGDEFVGGLADVFYMSVDGLVEGDDELGVGDLIVLFWDAGMGDAGMRFVMLNEGGDEYEVWDSERQLRGYVAGGRW